MSALYCYCEGRLANPCYGCPNMTPKRPTNWLFILWVIAIGVTIFVSFSGCSGSRRVAIDERSAVVTEIPDTLMRARPDTFVAGAATMPESVTLYGRSDTVSHATELLAVVADGTATGGTITIRTRHQGRVRDQTFRAPATGERLVVRPESTSAGEAPALRGSVSGRQKPVYVEVPKPPGFFARLALSVSWLIKGLLVLVFVLACGACYKVWQRAGRL